MTLKIISSEKTLYEGEVTSVTLPGEMGRFTVLPHHASIVSTLTKGVISYRTPQSGDTPVTLPIAGGIVDVDNDVVSVCIYY